MTAAKNHNLIVTPDNSPERFTAKEAALFRAGKCSWQVAYGMPWTEYCEVTSRPGASFGHCVAHDAEMTIDYWPDGSPRPA